jgi:prepilin-type N-terminal cleavage/methylation domain-containing protein/prepilin-type processing-associated H-X9-DG protein
MRRIAFSLIELLVVLAIISMLFGLLLGAVQKARSTAARVACQGHMRQIAIAIQNYEATHGAFPLEGGKLHLSNFSTLVFLLPFVEQEPLWQDTIRAAQIERFSYVDPPHVVAHAVVSLYTCPADWRLGEARQSRVGPRVGLTSYFNVATENGRDGMLHRNKTTKPTDVSDGLSNTLMMGERPPPSSFNSGWWYTAWLPFEWAGAVLPLGSINVSSAPTPSDPYCRGCFGNGSIDNEADRYHFWSLHPGGANFSFGDCSVRFLAYTAAPRMPALASIAGGEVVDPDR